MVGKKLKWEKPLFFHENSWGKWLILDQTRASTRIRKNKVAARKGSYFRGKKRYQLVYSVRRGQGENLGARTKVDEAKR